MAKKPPKTDLAGEIPERPLLNRARIVELMQARTIARDYSASYKDLIDKTAEKYKVKKGALRKFIAALEGDKKHELSLEVEDIEKLLEIDT